MSASQYKSGGFGDREEKKNKSGGLGDGEEKKKIVE